MSKKPSNVILLILFACLIILFGSVDWAQAETQAEDSKKSDVSPYSLDMTRELLILGTAGVTWATGAVAINNLDPLTDDEIFALDPLDVNPFDRRAIGVRRTTNAGDLFVHTSFLLPLTFLALGNTRKDFGTLAMMSAEVIVMNQGLNWLAKGTTRRTRPFVYEPESPHEDKTTTNARLSFFSGHTSTAASMTFFTAKVFSDYLTSKTAKTLIWTAAVLHPTLVAYLRRDSVNHFYTDVIAGYIIGALIGYGIPVLHKTKNLSLSPTISQSGYHFSIRYSF